MQQNCIMTHQMVVSSVKTPEEGKKTGIWSGEGFKPLAVISGKISEADIVNANGFLIPTQDWKDMLGSEVNQDRLHKGKMYCLVGHDERPVNDYDVRHGLISHIITDMWIEGKDVFMTANVCDNTAGKDLMGVIGAGGYIQASTRLGIVPRKDPETGADCLIGAESIIYGVDLVLDPAIESTWLEFKAASKTTEQTVLSSVQKEEQDINARMGYVKKMIEFHKELSDFYRGVIK